MKKAILFLLTLGLVLSLAACGQSQAAQSPVPTSMPSPTPGLSPTPEAPSTQAPVSGSKTLVVYFSATNRTESVAQIIAEAQNADLFELVPVEEYSAEDLNYNDAASRVSYEHEHPEAQAIELVAVTPDNWADYDTVFIGYPIWWHAAAWPVNGFVTSNDFTGKTVIPFCTSGSSGLEDSGTKLRDMAGTGDWLEGQRFSGSASPEEVTEWVNSLELDAAAPSQPASSALVVYFSMPETSEPDNMTEEEANSTVVINGEVLGNTQYMAYTIQEATGADIFRIEPETPYPTAHDTLVDQARDEQNRAFRPAIKGAVENLDNYDIIYLGYPNWWGDLPMILYSFLEQYDLSGKIIVPFNTHGGSGFSSTISTIAELQPDATVLEDGLTISRNHIQDAKQEILDWVNSLDI